VLEFGLSTDQIVSGPNAWWFPHMRFSDFTVTREFVSNIHEQDGFMIHSGQPAKEFIDSATRHVLLRQGVLGIKVKIMRGSDPEGKSGPQKTLPDSVTIIEPKEEQPVLQPMSQDYGAKAVAAQQLAEQQRLAEQQAAEAEGGAEAYAQE